MKKEKVKKPIFKRWWFWLIIIIVALAAFGGGNKDAAAPAENSANTITLAWDQAGEYGREIVLNAGTDDEYKFYGFYLPAGDYKAEYKESKGAAQISIYVDGISTRDDGIEEPIVSETSPIVAYVGETYQFTLKEGEYIKLSDGSKNVVLEKLG